MIKKFKINRTLKLVTQPADRTTCNYTRWCLYSSRSTPALTSSFDGTASLSARRLLQTEGRDCDRVHMQMSVGYSQRGASARRLRAIFKPHWAVLLFARTGIDLVEATQWPWPAFLTCRQSGYRSCRFGFSCVLMPNCSNDLELWFSASCKTQTRQLSDAILSPQLGSF